jgi:nitrate reductase alpha subunit
MSHFLDRLLFFTVPRETFSDGLGVVTHEDRTWENGYRSRWQSDKIVRSTHGVNCTGSCSWRIFVKNGLIAWELQQTDYPRTRPDLPNHEPRGCPRGASYSWYVYSAQRLKYPLIRAPLLERWRAARATQGPVEAWAAIVEDREAARAYKSLRGRGGFVRATWEEAAELIAAANIYTIKTYGPDRVVGFSPIPAMSMVSYAAGSRYLSLIGGVCLSFYDWYCDLPPSSPQVWGEQTDVPESADWYSAMYLMVWGSNVPQTRTPDAHFYTEVRYKGAKTVAVSPDYGEMVKFADLWLAPKAGTDAALALAMGHVILKEFHLAGRSAYFDRYCRQYSDLPMLVMLTPYESGWVPDRFLRAADLEGALLQENNPEWKTVVFDERTGYLMAPNGSIGFRWGETGKWNLELHDEVSRQPIQPRLTLLDVRDDGVRVGFPNFDAGNASLLWRLVPAKRVVTVDGEAWVATVYDLLAANYGLDRGLGDDRVAKGYDDDMPCTPAWAERLTGIKRETIVTVAREFADNADKTEGRSMVIVGAGINQWYHNDMIYRAIINMLVMCGCVGQSGGGWAHYVGQEKLRPLAGWAPLAFALDWHRPARQMNGTSFFYAHTDQWRYESLNVGGLLSPIASTHEPQFIDYNVRAERMGWLPSAPQLETNPLEVTKAAAAQGEEPAAYAVRALQKGTLRLACEDPDNPRNFPRNLFVWRSNLLGSSGKGVEYFERHLLGAQNAVMNVDLAERGGVKPKEVVWRDPAPEGKLDLLVTMDFRMSTTCLYSDVVLPTATWYEKDDLNTTDMHPFIHPLSEAVQPLWQSKSDWETYKTIAKKFSELAATHLGTQQDLVLTPLQHDSPNELGQAVEVKDWKRGECEPIPGKTMPTMTVVTREYGETYRKFTALGPLLDKLGNGSKGLVWNTDHEVAQLAAINRRAQEGAAQGRPRLDTALDACEAILMLAPETNGEVAVKAWEALSRFTGQDHSALARSRQGDKLRFRDLVAQPRKVISSPVWSGLESEEVTYNGGYTNVHEKIPWRTLTGRQQFYLDHPWIRDFGESLAVYKPALQLGSTQPIIGEKGNGNEQIVLSWITPHQKWGIHSTFSDTQIMLTLSRGGPHIWISESDARAAGIGDNDWIEAYNVNGAITARAVVSQRVPRGMAIMYHAQGKVVNVPGAETSGIRGGIHNSVTRVVVKPTHMIGGYAQFSYGFNYYGTVGSNRDDYVIVRKMNIVDWMEGAAAESTRNRA